MGKILNLSRITNSIRSFKSSIFSAKKTTLGMKNFLFKKTKVKKETIQGKKTFLSRKKEYKRREENEKLLEAKEIVSSPIRAITKATGGFLSRILSFLGTLLLGWLMNNLPTIIAMAQELIARIQRMFSLLRGFIGNIFNIVKNFGQVLGSIFQNIITFDFFDTSNRVKNSLSDLEKTFTDMGKQLDEGIKLATTSLDQAIAPGGPREIPAMGTDYTQDTSAGFDPSGYATAGLSGVSQQRIGNDIDFLKEVKRVAQKYGLREGDLLGLMASESGFDPSQDNGSHVGLIQFSVDSARLVGTSQAALKRMTRAQQMKYVDLYFEKVGLPKGANAAQLYTSIFAPAYLDRASSPNSVLYSSPSREYKSNAPLDTNKDGKITTSEMSQRIERKKKEFGISDNISVTERPVAGTGSPGAASALAAAAKSLKGMSSAAAPGGGRVGCVWAVNQVFKKAGLTPPWGSSEYVPTAEQMMIKSGYTVVPENQRRAGDIYISYDRNSPPQIHIGIVLDNGNILSNSSSGAKFSWEGSPADYYAEYDGVKGKFYRMPGGSQQTRPAPAQVQGATNTTAATLNRTNVTGTSGFMGSTNVVDTGYKDANGRSIKLNPGAAQAFKQMISAGMPFKSSEIANVYRDESEYLRLKSQGYSPAKNSKHNYGEAADIHGGMNSWIRKYGAKYGWYANDYSGSHGGHFEWKGSRTSPTTPTTPAVPSRPTVTPPPTTAAPSAPSITPTPSAPPATPSAPAAQVSSTLASQQLAQTIQTSTTPQQQTIFINDVQQPQPIMSAPSGGNIPQPMTVSGITLLNRFMKHHILLDLAYT